MADTGSTLPPPLVEINSKRLANAAAPVNVKAVAAPAAALPINAAAATTAAPVNVKAVAVPSVALPINAAAAPPAKASAAKVAEAPMSLPLKTKVEDLGVLDQITHLGKQFTEGEKKQYFNSLPGKKYKVGLIRNKELDTVVKIFTESFDFSKKISLSLSKADMFVSKVCSGDEGFAVANSAAARTEEVSVRSGDSAANNVSEEEVSVGTVDRAIANNVSARTEEGSVRSGDSAANNVSEEEVSVRTGDRAAAVGGANNNNNNKSVDPYANVPKSASDPYNADNLDDIPLNGFNRSDNSEVEGLNVPPEKIGTSSDFERLYLGWLNNPALGISSPNGLSDEEKQKKRNSVKSLFRFVFGTKNISDVTATTLQKKLRLAYTPLTSEEKLPCEDSGFWPDFRESLVYRRRLAMCELFAARDVLGGEKRLYINRKKELALGLRDLIDVLDRNVYPCMVYAYDASQHEEERDDLMNDEEFSRILKVFRTFVKDKKEGREYYSMNTLKKELSKKDKSFETSSLLYAELLSLLTWMAGEADATAKIAKLQSDLSTVRGIAEKQKEDITGLEDLVILLSVILAMSEKIHKITLALSELKCQVEKCCNKKKAEKLARSVSVQNADIQTLEKEIQKTNEEYQVVLTKLKKNIGKQSDDIQELEEVVLALTQILISIDKVHTMNMNLSDMRHKLKECCEKKKQVNSYMSQIESLNKVLLKRDTRGIGGIDAQTVAARSMMDQGLQFANTANSELEKQITELRQSIKSLVEDGVKKGKIIEELETKSVNKDVMIRELEEVTEALLKVIIGVKGIHDIERNVGALDTAIQLCCERKKTARQCQEKLDLLEARVHELIEKEGKTKELEAALQTIQEQKQKAEEAGAALKGQLNVLKSELEDVMGNSQDELESVRSDLREEANKDSEHAAELAARIQELESQLIAAEATVKEAEGRGSSNARQPMVVQNSRQYEKELVNASLVRETASAAAIEREKAAEEAKKVADADLAKMKKELEESVKEAKNRANDLDEQLKVALANQAVKEAESNALIAKSEASVASALAQAAASDANRNKSAKNLRNAKVASQAAETAREEIDAARARAENQLAGAFIEMNRSKENRDRMNDLLKKIKKQMADQDDRHDVELAAAQAAEAEALAAVETSASASNAERDMLAAQLAERVAALAYLQGQQTDQSAAMAELQIANAALAAKLLAVNATAAEATEALAKDDAKAAKAAELAKIEEAARKAAETALEDHKKKIAELIAVHETVLEGAANTKSRSEAVQRAQQTEIEELARQSSELATELEAARAAAGQAGATANSSTGEINRLSKRIKQLDQESLYKNRLISHLEEEAHELHTLAKPKSVFNRLYPKNPLISRDRSPAWKPSGSPSEYTGRAAMGVSGSRGVGQKGGVQKGSAPKKSFCEVMLTLLLLELSENEEFNAEVFLKKAGTTLDELGQCPLVLRALAEIMDETLNQEVPEDGYMYSPTNVTNTAFAEQLESAYANNFTQAEKKALLHSAPPIIYYSKSPEEFEGILGNRPYFLNGANAQPGEDIRLRGVNMDDDEDPVMMTGEERELVEKGGVPLGTIIFLYLTCLKDHEEEEGEEGRLALRSNASNDAAN